jgi:hypothetical protein
LFHDLPIPSLLQGVADGILGAPNRVLYLAGGLLRGAFGLRLCIASHFANSLFYGPFDLVNRTVDTIFVHIALQSCPQSTLGVVVWLLNMKAVFRDQGIVDFFRGTGGWPEPKIELTGMPGCCLQSTVRATDEAQMKFMLLPAAFTLFMGSIAAPAEAAGCLKGAAVGGVAGHYAGHHGVLGAGAGCVIGHHEATKHARERTQQQQQGSSNDSQANPNSGH